MLGITTPDAVLILGAIGSILAAWKGGSAGAAAKKTDPVVPTSTSTLADIELLTNALTLLHAAVLKLTAELEERNRQHDLDEEVQKRLDARQLTLLAEQLKAGGRTRRQD